MPAADEEPSPGSAVRSDAEGKTILIVDDQPDVLEVIEMSLAGLGYRILTAPDGVVAREILESSEAVDLLLSDIAMPNGVSRLDLARAGRRIRPELKIVLISGYARDGQSRAGMASDDVVFLEKPFRQEMLAAALASVFRGSAEHATT